MAEWENQGNQDCPESLAIKVNLGDHGISVLTMFMNRMAIQCHAFHIVIDRYLLVGKDSHIVNHKQLGSLISEE